LSRADASGPAAEAPGTASSVRPAARTAKPSVGVRRIGRLKNGPFHASTDPSSSSTTVIMCSAP
jgi:hypothetical protein